MIFFPVVTLIYYLIPRKLKVYWLLAASYYFYMSWNVKYALLMAICTVISWVIAFAVAAPDKIFNRPSGESETGRQSIPADCLKKLFLISGIVINVGILGFYKYSNFLLNNIGLAVRFLTGTEMDTRFDVILPLGISFYIFKTLSYLIDVYRGDIKPEKDILKYALYVSFFPQVVSGPIDRAVSLLPKIDSVPQSVTFDAERVYRGLLLMLWGLFLKLMIADRLAILVNTVFGSYYLYGSFALLTAAIGYSIQLYCDFAGYSVLSIGASKVLGFEVADNFDTPYFSSSIKEFWRRWHISLGNWLKYYVYIPLGGSRCGTVRKYLNTMIVFLVCGIWHGANWTFVVWGALNGLYLILADLFKPFWENFNSRFHVRTESFSYRFGQIFTTFLLVVFTRIFSRSNSVTDAVDYICRIFTRVDLWSFFNGSLYKLGLDVTEMHIIFVSVLVVFAVDMCKFLKGKGVDEFISEQCVWFQWLCILLVFFSIAVYGIYGESFNPQQFIYFRF